MIKKLSAILLAVFFLSSCGKETAREYICEQITKDGEMLSVNEYFSSPPILTLTEKNKAILEINGGACDGTWENDNEKFILYTGDKISSGTMKDDVCSVDLFGQGVIYDFCADSFLSADREETEKSGVKNNRWSGAWYGYWSLQNASGKWENFDGQNFDCFAKIDMNIDNFGEITLWDEKSSLSEPLAVVKLHLAPSSALYGMAKSESGFFLSDDIEKGEWQMKPDKEALENLLSFSSHYSSPTGEFDYEVFLRPWGYVWDDAIENECIRLPYYYNQWYLPMLSRKASMPDSFEP